jgi:hypothetical protein
MTDSVFTGDQKSAFDIMSDLLSQYGLGSLSGVLQNLILDGITDQSQLQIELQNTQEWKTRFAGNEALKASGLPVLSVAEYLSVERSYAQVMKNYGLPTGFYDDPSDFAKWIGGSVSPNELQQRVQAFADIQRRQDDPAVVAQLESMGFSKGDMLAHLMDPDRAMPILERQYQSTLLGAAARRAGTTASDNEYLGHLTDIGISEQQAAQGYGIIAENLGDVQRAGSIYGEDFTKRDFETEIFEQNGDASKKQKRLASRERAAFQGSAGVGQGSLRRNSAGSY